MNKGELIDAVQESMGDGASKRAAQDCVDAVLNAISAGIKNDKSVQIVGFGSFKVTERKARTGTNPQTGQPMEIGPSKSVKFSPSSALKGTL